MQQVSEPEQLVFPFAKDYEKNHNSNVIEIGLHTREDQNGIMQPVDCAFLPFDAALWFSAAA